MNRSKCIKPIANMDQLLHRGEYAIQGEHEHEVKKPPTGLKAILPSAEFTFSDRFIYYAKLAWTLIWFLIFIIGTIYNLAVNVPDSSWALFWAWQFGINLVVGTITTIWFFIGGIYDVQDMFKTLRSAKREMLDDGMVVGHHNLGEQAVDKEKFEDKLS
jgi:SSS family solute:Na+ symporter